VIGNWINTYFYQRNLKSLLLRSVRRELRARIFWNDDTTCSTRVPRVLSTTGWKARNPALSRQHAWHSCRAGRIISENPRGIATHMVYWNSEKVCVANLKIWSKKVRCIALYCVSLFNYYFLDTCDTLNTHSNISIYLLIDNSIQQVTLPESSKIHSTNQVES